MSSRKTKNTGILSNISLTAMLLYVSHALPARAAEELNLQVAMPSAPLEVAENTFTKDTEHPSDIKPVCRDRRTVIVSGLDLLSKKEQTHIVDHIPLCIEQKNLNDFSKLMTASFVSAGYFKIHINHQSSTKSDDIHLSVEPVRIDDIVGASKTINPDFIFPGYKNHPYLHRRDLDQGLEQINRLSSNHAEIDVDPSSDSAVIIRLKNQEKERLHGSIGIDNSGEIHTGKVMRRASVSLDSPLGFSDFLSMGGSQSSGTQNISTSYNVPYGYWLLNGNISEYSKESTILLNDVKAQNRCRTQQASVQLERIIQRNGESITRLSGQLLRASVRKTLSDNLIEHQSPVITKSLIALHHTMLLSSSSLKVNVEWQRGLEKLNATKDIAEIERQNPHAQFDKLMLSDNWSGSIPIHHHTLNYEQQFLGQYSTQRLYGREQLSISDAPYIRGMSDWDVSGDNGFVFRNTLSMPFNQSNVYVSPRIGMDIGKVWNTWERNQKQQVRSASIGLTLRTTSVNIDLEYASGKTSSTSTAFNQLYASGTWSF